MSAWEVMVEFVVKNKEVLGAMAAILGAGAAAIWKAMSQAKKPDALSSENATFAPRPMTVRLHADDRAAVTELKDVICDLSRSVRRHGDIMADSTDTLSRRTRRT